MAQTKWSAYVLLGYRKSNRLVKVEFLCPTNLREDAEQRVKAMYDTDDVRQLKREW